MAEYDTILIKNPTTEDFSVRFNGELYKLAAGDSRAYPAFVAFHIAKHLSNKMLDVEARKLMEEFKENPFVPQVSVLMNHDNPSRRIALHQILLKRNLVEDCMIAVQLKSFIGDMSVYDKFIAKEEEPEIPEEIAKIEPEPSVPVSAPPTAPAAKKVASKKK